MTADTIKLSQEEIESVNNNQSNQKKAVHSGRGNSNNDKQHRGRRSKLLYKVKQERRIFFIMLVLFVLPWGMFGVYLMQNAKNTHAPEIGSRYDGDLNPAITSDKMEGVLAAAKAINGVSDAMVTMPTATLRVYIQASDANADNGEAYLDSLKSAVESQLPMNTYFTQTDTKKMYDLQLDVVNSFETPTYHLAAVKTSASDQFTEETVSTPKDAEYAQELRDAVNGVTAPIPSSVPEASAPAVE